jgi:hypothetical protein
MFFITNLSARNTRALIIFGSIFFQTVSKFRKRKTPSIPNAAVIPEIKVVKASNMLGK